MERRQAREAGRVGSDTVAVSKRGNVVVLEYSNRFEVNLWLLSTDS